MPACFKRNPIRRYRVDNHNNRKDVPTPFHFFGMSEESALDISGRAKLCTRYGSVSDNVILTEDGESCDDWNILIQFENESLNMLCWPEDLVCTSIVIVSILLKTSHAHNDADVNMARLIH